MKFATLIALVGLTKAVRLTQRSSIMLKGDEEKSGQQQAWDNCNFNKDDFMDYSEVYACADGYRHVLNEQGKDGDKKADEILARIDAYFEKHGGDDYQFSHEEWMRTMHLLFEGEQDDDNNNGNPHEEADKIFETCNENGNQFLTKKEIKGCVEQYKEHIPEETYNGILKRLNKYMKEHAGEDGKLDSEEWRHTYKELVEGPSEPNHEEADGIWGHCNFNGNQFLTKKELKDCLEQFREHIPDHTYNGITSRMNKYFKEHAGEDGKLDQAEWRATYKELVEGPHHGGDNNGDDTNGGDHGDNHGGDHGHHDEADGIFDTCNFDTNDFLSQDEVKQCIDMHKDYLEPGHYEAIEGRLPGYFAAHGGDQGVDRETWRTTHHELTHWEGGDNDGDDGHDEEHPADEVYNACNADPTNGLTGQEMKDCIRQYQEHIGGEKPANRLISYVDQWVVDHAGEDAEFSQEEFRHGWELLYSLLANGDHNGDDGDHQGPPEEPKFPSVEDIWAFCNDNGNDLLERDEALWCVDHFSNMMAEYHREMYRWHVNQLFDQPGHEEGMTYEQLQGVFPSSETNASETN